LAQSQVLEGALAVAAEEDGEEAKQVEQESDHRAKMVDESRPTDEPVGRRMRFWRRTPCRARSTIGYEILTGLGPHIERVYIPAEMR
jgi:hypothetical protein